VDAATKGAMMGTQLVLGIIANLIAFVSFVAFVNGMLSWFGMLVGFEGLNLEVSYTAVRSGINSFVFLCSRLINLEHCL
jgi:pyrimidine nucleoside transport protein